MTAQLLKSEPETSSNTDNQERNVTHVSEEEHEKRLIQNLQEEMQTLKKMKQEEKQEKISNGRRKWFNSEISSLRERIRQLEGDETHE